VRTAKRWDHVVVDPGQCAWSACSWNALGHCARATQLALSLACPFAIRLCVGWLSASRAVCPCLPCLPAAPTIPWTRPRPLAAITATAHRPFLIQATFARHHLQHRRATLSNKLHRLNPSSLPRNTLNHVRVVRLSCTIILLLSTSIKRVRSSHLLPFPKFCCLSKVCLAVHLALSSF
jgi:hypothetical protein